MDINLLAVDIGHARVKLGVIEAGELVTSQRVTLDQPENLTGALEEAWRRFENKSAEVAAASSMLTTRKLLQRAAALPPGRVPIDAHPSQRLQWRAESPCNLHQPLPRSAHGIWLLIHST